MPSMIQSRVASKGLSKSSALEKEETAVEPSGWSKQGKDEEVKLEILLARCQKSREELEIEKFWHFLLMKEFLVSWHDYGQKYIRHEAWVSIDGWLRYCLWTTSLSLTVWEQAELNQGFLALLLEKVWRMYNSMPEIITKRRISDMEAIIILKKIRIILPEVLPLSRVEMPEAPLRLVLRLHRSDRTDNGNKIVIRGAQRQGKFESA